MASGSTAGVDVQRFGPQRRIRGQVAQKARRSRKKRRQLWQNSRATRQAEEESVGSEEQLRTRYEQKAEDVHCDG